MTLPLNNISMSQVNVELGKSATAQALGYRVKREVGVSAQEVQAVLPEIIAPAPIDAKYMTVHYERLVPLLIEAVKELTKRIEQLEGK